MQLVRDVQAVRLLVDVSFVTAKQEPEDVDALVQLTPVFETMLAEGRDNAIEFFEMLSTRQPEEIFAAEDSSDWDGWVESFSRTSELTGVRKGLVEILL